MDNAVETEMVGNFEIEIFRDDDPGNSRDWDNLGHMVCWHNRYNLGDEQRRDSSKDFFQELAEAVDDTVAGRIEFWENDKWYDSDPILPTPDPLPYERINALITKAIGDHYIMLPLALLDHSGLHMYVGSRPHWTDFGVWDSGQVGWIYVTKKQVRKEYGWKVITKKRIEKIKSYLEAEVKMYDRFLTGQIYGFVITEHGICKHCGANIVADIDSCWGNFMDSGDLLKDVKDDILSFESELGDCTCDTFKKLKKALMDEKEMFDFVSDEGVEALAARLDARLRGS